MDNYAIADQFALLAKLMDIHGENAFKAKSYASAAFTIEKLTTPLADMSEEQIVAVRGIGESAGKKIVELRQTGVLKALQDLLRQTPEGVLEMMNIKGLGPKKIAVLWKDMGIDAIEDLEAACRENRVAAVKGFGAKTEQKILEAIAFTRGAKGQFLYKQVEELILAIQVKLEEKFGSQQVAVTGAFRRQAEVIAAAEWVTTIPTKDLKDFLLNEEATLLSETDDALRIMAGGQLALHFYLASPATFAQRLFETTGSDAFLDAWKAGARQTTGTTEAEIFATAGVNFIPPYLRESAAVLEKAATQTFDDIVQVSSIKGIIHSHSNWSDGGFTIEQMAEELIGRGFEYLVISDHSKAAFYANGLSVDRIKEQHRYIDALNEKYAPFKIFKGIECDILADGTLDYDDKTLASFDVVITSVHSNLDMDEEKAMARLLGAIANPYTTILGHLTGRLLLRRKGYPVDHKAIIDACARHHVVIEINASPSRLDIDWRWIAYALTKGVMLSINPDAHGLEEMQYIKYGTLVAQKGGLLTSSNLSSLSLVEFENYLRETRVAKGFRAA